MNESRLEHKNVFLKTALTTPYNHIELIPQDASLRKYARIFCGNISYILMDCPPEHYSLDPFINVATTLKNHDIKVPEIHQIDHHNGFLLLEDFGRTRIKDILSNDQNRNYFIYKSIIELLLQIQSIQTNALPDHDLATMNQGIELFVDWYLPLKESKFDVKAATKNQTAIQQKYSGFRKEYTEKWRSLLKDIDKNTVTMRDFHVENLMHIAPSQIGVLDFQDAALSHITYDLASLLQDARFNVPVNLESDLIKYYLSLNPSLNKEEFNVKYYLMAAQRNSRILGVFARKAMQDNAPQYANLIPLVVSYLKRNLKHDILKQIAKDLSIINALN